MPQCTFTQYSMVNAKDSLLELIDELDIKNYFSETEDEDSRYKIKVTIIVDPLNTIEGE